MSRYSLLNPTKVEEPEEGHSDFFLIFASTQESIKLCLRYTVNLALQGTIHILTMNLLTRL